MRKDPRSRRFHSLLATRPASAARSQTLAATLFTCAALNPGFTAGASAPATRLSARAVAAAVALGVTLTSSPGAGAQDGCSYTDYMLRPSAQPLSYAIYWRPQFASPFNFAGSTTIDTLVTADGQACIQVHAYNTLNFTGVAVESASAPGVLTPVTYTWNVPSTERIIIRLPAAVDAGARLKLHFNFTSPLGQDMVGLYQSTYTDDGGSTVNIVTTQFEATYARRAYPCFDEPAYKAVYNMTLDGVPAGYTALSNMPVASSVSNPDGTSLVTFQSSPKMSTYLVAAVVAPMIKVSGTAGHNNVLGEGGARRGACPFEAGAARAHPHTRSPLPRVSLPSPPHPSRVCSLRLRRESLRQRVPDWLRAGRQHACAGVL